MTADMEKLMDNVGIFFDTMFTVLPYVLGLIVVVAIFVTVASIYNSTRRFTLLADALDGVVDLNASVSGVKYLDKSFDYALGAAIHKKAIFDFQSRFEMTTDVYGDPRPEFLDHEQKLYTQYYNMIFECYEIEGRWKTKKVYFTNPEFLEWLRSQTKQYQVQDFVKAVVTYMRYIECELKRNFDTDDDIYLDKDGYAIDRDGNRLESIQERAERLAAEEKATTKDIAKSVQAIKSKKDSKEVRQKSIERYQRCIDHVKENGGKGLLPDRPQSVPTVLYHSLYSLKVYGDQQIARMMYDDRWDHLSEAGCYLVYDTYNGKYFVGKADNIYPALKSCLDVTPGHSNNAITPSLIAGHRVLVKMVPLQSSGFSDIDKLYEALIRAYKAYAPVGYNSAAINQ